VSKQETSQVNVSVIIPVTDHYDDVAALYYEYKEAIVSLDTTYEIIYVLDGDYPDVLNELKRLQQTESITVITLAKYFGEATALNAAFSKSSGDILVTLPAYRQIESREIPRLVHATQDADMVLARRWPRKDPFFNRLQTRLFNALLRLSTDLRLHDAGCSVRAFRREVVDEVQIYADLHRFFPVMAHRQGFRVIEIDIEQSHEDTGVKVYAPGLYVRRLLDLLTIFFLIKFTKKPLRFFGLIGTGLFAAGAAGTIFVVIQRLFMDMALAQRPALILSSLLVVLGIQIIAIGLIGEIIIFTHAREMKEYRIEKIISSASKDHDQDR